MCTELTFTFQLEQTRPGRPTQYIKCRARDLLEHSAQAGCAEASVGARLVRAVRADAWPERAVVASAGPERRPGRSTGALVLYASSAISLRDRRGRAAPGGGSSTMSSSRPGGCSRSHARLMSGASGGRAFRNTGEEGAPEQTGKVG